MRSDILQRAKGVRDFGPAEKIARNKIIATLREVFELYGYNPIETPSLERYELFASKYGAGEESDAMRETFKLTDQGDRNLVLRTEFTVPFARFVGMNPQLKMPFKRYQMGQVFRDGPIKLGRYREFWQCDVDVVGISDNYIDAELIELAKAAFKKLDLEIEIKVNNRKILNNILIYAGIPEEMQNSVIITIDKLDKIGEAGVKEELAEKNISDDKIDKILNTISIDGSNEIKIEKIRNIIGENDGLKEIETTLKNLVNKDNVVFTPSLARGLAYYTGNVFEVFLQDKSEINSSIAAGGRFDNMISGFLDSEQIYPAIGLSFGLDTIFDAIKSKTIESEIKRSVAEVYVIPMGEEAREKAFSMVLNLRKQGISADMDFISRKIGKNMEFADSYGIPFVILIGEEELKNETYTLRNMKSGNQEALKKEQILERLK